MRSLLNITKALADANRIRIVCALGRCGELCVCQIHEFLELAPSTTSAHLSLLVNAGLVESRKEGRWVYYRLARDGEAPAETLEVASWLCRRASGEKQVVEDGEKLARIMGLTPEALCQLQAKGVRCCSSAPETPAEAKWPKDSPGCCGPE